MKNRILWPVVLILVFALSRWPGLIPHADRPLNFSAAYALAFCAGLYLPRRLAWTVPLGVMAATDLLLTFLYYHPHGYSLLQFARDQAPNYAAYALIIGLGVLLGGKRPWGTLLCVGIFGAILFYLITNTGSWITSPFYAKTFAGWIQALTTGLPGYPPTWTFFRGTLLSGGIFSALFIGAMKLVEAAEPAPAQEEAEPAEEPGEEAAPLAPAADGASKN
ncbi:MAG: DUF6580 family putative transport protein [Verrucomicrobiota bacterium]